MKLKQITVIVMLFCSLSGTRAQVQVAINSGNPAFPFPQYQIYENGSGSLGNLGTRNGAGVTHAEMEQVIRDAYQIMMNRATKPGGGVGGIDYVKFKSNPDCSEGSGYGILGAAAMADKKTFDGMWLWIHDYAMNKVKRYSDGQESSPGYAYSRLPGWQNVAGSNSATDGDVDIALALLIAYFQWGEFMGINDASGNPISYKYEAIEFIKAMTDTFTFTSSGTSLNCGDIGLDGYFKGGDTWQELTNWASDISKSGFSKPPNFSGPTKQHIDYTAPSYFNQFAKFLESVDAQKYTWNIKQFRRAEASSDWLMAQFLKNPKHLPLAGWVELSTDNNATFSKFDLGEDFRAAWRTILNRMWHGDPSYTWDPQAHQITNDKANTYEYDLAKRFARFMWDSRQSPWGNPCAEGANKTFTYWGPMTLVADLDMNGIGGGFFYLNWMPSVGSPSAVISQDFELMADLYRQLEIEWDVEEPGDGYLSSVPKYYHGWFRLLGLLVLSGNYHAPINQKASANTKAYLSINKTFAFDNDSVTYTIDYRNYGSIDAKEAVLTDTLHKDFEYISSTGGGNYNNSSHVVTWNLGTIPGFKTNDGVAPTKGQVKLTIKVKNPTQKQYRNKVSIKASNSPEWTSNEYPNNITTVMERNYLDIAKRALIIKKKTSKSLVKPGSTVDFTIDFKNSSEAGWINGGRPGVRFSYSHSAPNGKSTMNTMRFRLFHDADEAYVDYGNYRVSYFLYDSLINGLQGGSGSGWAMMQTITEGIEKSDFKIVHEPIIYGEDSLGKWNQRLVIQFSDPLDANRKLNLATIDRHLSQYRGMRMRIHKGGISPLRLVWFINSSSWNEVNWSDDWSYNPKASDDDGGMYLPVTSDWTDPDKPDIPVNSWNPKACTTSSHTVNNVLVEEWDGYTWRRVAGNGPMPGREVNNVVIKDTIPEGFSFVAFTGQSPLGIAPTIKGNIITWSIPHLQIQQGGSITYTVLANGSCPDTPDRVTVNRAWISADKESPFADSVIVIISCDTVLKPNTPDHFDIIIDTTAINLYGDEPLLRLELDAGTITANVYVVIRDKNGMFIEKAKNVTWTSRNNSIATAQSISGKEWAAIVTKSGEGSTFLIASDPQNPSIKSDSVAVTAVATPPWPAITKAKMGDDNGDIVPDIMFITLNNSFGTNQKLDSVVVNYKGYFYSIPATSVTLQGTQLTFTLNNITVADPQPIGQVTLIMTVDGAQKRVTKDFTDGVGPVIIGARLGEDISGSRDTLSLTFSENVNTEKLAGPMLQVIKKGTNDTVLLTVHTVLNPEIYTKANIIVSGGNGYRPQIGDYVRFLPGDKGQTCSDISGNFPHRLNKPAIIGAKSPQIIKAWYTDENGDGIVKDIYIHFARFVTINDMNISLNWGENNFSGIDKSLLRYHNNDSSLVHLLLPDNFTSRVSVSTSGKIYLNIELTTYSESRQGVATDSAAPVITNAVIIPAVKETENIADTLRVTFSEDIEFRDAVTPFNFSNNKSVQYSMDLSFHSSNRNTATFIIKSYPKDAFPQTGDSIWINKGAIADTLDNTQNISTNRKARLTVQHGELDFSIKVGPNPFGTDDKKTCTIRVVPKSKFGIGFKIDASISILDALGNSVIPYTPMLFDESSHESVYMWNGTNQKNRLTGSGSYMIIVKVSNETGDTIKKVLVGVKR